MKQESLGFGLELDLALDSEDQIEDAEIIAGVDEAGRGPLCGEVFAAAVILDPENPIEGLDDSKKLTEKKRTQLAIEIKAKAKSWAIASSSVEEIDEINILQATLLAMRRAAEMLDITPTLLRVDGNQNPKSHIPAETIVKGDALFSEISAASILAKDARDQSMIEMDAKYPEYGFAKHKGYGTKAHMEALQEYGVTPIHRKSFAPIRKLIEASKD